MIEHFLLPSSRQILAYSEGEFFNDNIPSFYRFHTGRTFIWIEYKNSLYNLYVRGYYYNEWIPKQKLIMSLDRLSDAVSWYFSIVRRLLNDLYT